MNLRLYIFYVLKGSVTSYYKPQITIKTYERLDTESLIIGTPIRISKHLYSLNCYRDYVLFLKIL